MGLLFSSNVGVVAYKHSDLDLLPIHYDWAP